MKKGLLLLLLGVGGAIALLSFMQAGPATPSVSSTIPGAAQAGLGVMSWLILLAAAIALVAVAVLLYKLHFFNKWLLLGVAVAGLFLYGLFVHDWELDWFIDDIVTAEWQQVPLVIVAAAAVFGIIAVYLGDKKKLKALLVMSCIIVMTYVTYLLYKHGTIVGSVGMRRNMMYIFAGGLVVLAAMYVTNGWQKFVAFCLFAAIFTMVGFSHFVDWNTFSGKIASISWSGNGGTVASAPSLPRGVPVFEATLTDDNQTELNEGALCKIDWHEATPGQCVHVYDINGRHLGNDCGGFIDLTGRNPARFSAARGGLVKITYTLSQCR